MQVTYGPEFFPVAKPITARDKAERLEQAMLTLPQIDCPVRWLFASGMCAREIRIPTGVTIVGAVHRMDNIAELSQGRLLLVTDGEAIELVAPCKVVVIAGAKTAVTTLDDVVWTNYLPNPSNEQDPDKLVEMFTESKACELIGGSHNRQLMANKLTELEA